MPSQQAETLETIHALKRALRREREAATDEPITSATNRGNKLKRGATYVHSGALPYPRGPDGYKQQIEHAGYTRYILDTNPKRYNEFGDELEDSESDPEADADAATENPYSGIQLEELLGPLKHPSELATHPTLSIPFLDNALPYMAQSTEAKLRQERANLWRAKQLHRQFIGDESWMPLSAVETPDDWDLLDPRPKELEPHTSSKKRKRNADHAAVRNGAGEENHEEATNGIQPATTIDNQTLDVPKGESAQQGIVSSESPTAQPETTGPVEFNEAAGGEDTEMEDAKVPANGDHPSSTNQQDSVPSEQQGSLPPRENENTDPKERVSNTASAESTPPPPRRITRALAAEANPSSHAETPPPTSPTISTISSDLLTPDPLFLVSHPTTTFNPTLSLPKSERDETRRLLTMYIQKQEETIRSTENVLGKLVKALRLRSTLFEWCKAEGHIGEWSDGEDWIDADFWGERKEDLKKGRDEDDPANVPGNGDDEGYGIAIQGGKKKRRRRGAGDRE